MRTTLGLLGTALLLSSVADRAADIPAAAAGRSLPPFAKVVPVTETLWGRKVTDNYRYMEALDPSTIEWMKTQGTYTRSVLDGIKPLANLKADVAKFSASFGLIQGYVQFGGRAFYEERAPGSDNFDLIVADGAGTRKLVDVAALRAANAGKPYAINYFLASPDGGKVAVGISEGGSEDAVLSVLRCRRRKQNRRTDRSSAVRRHLLERRFEDSLFRSTAKARGDGAAHRQIQECNGRFLGSEVRTRRPIGCRRGSRSRVSADRVSGDNGQRRRPPRGGTIDQRRAERNRDVDGTGGETERSQGRMDEVHHSG